MGITSYDGFVSQISNGFSAKYPIWDELDSAASTYNIGLVRQGFCTKLPNPLPTGVTGYIATKATITNTNSNGTYMICWLVNLGSFTVGTGFTAGVSMPSRTELGVSTVMSSPIVVEITTAFSSVVGSITLTYTNQSGTPSQITPSFVISSTSPIRSSGYIPLATGDWGVQSISGVSGSPTGTGVMQFWGIIPITIMFCLNQGNIDNFVTSLIAPISMPAGYDIGAFSLGIPGTRATLGEITIVGNN